MLAEEISGLYKKFRLLTYRELFGRIREKDGSLSATESFTADVIYLLGNPTVTKLADTIGVSQPNATYKVNNLVTKGYVTKTASSDDRRECRLSVSDRFHNYYDDSTGFISAAAEVLAGEYSEEEIALFEKMLGSLKDAMN